jgi:hypothetical protein
MKREARLLLVKSIDSLMLSIEHFNRPWNQGREEVVLILLDRAFELLLKAAIVKKGGRIREPRAKETIGHDKCVRRCLTDDQVRCLSEDQALTIQIINSLRDAAQHFLLEISEQQLYLYAQAGVTLIDSLLRDVFSVPLAEYLPERVLPISTCPPRDLHVLMDTEFGELKAMVRPGSRRRIEARAKIRSIAIVEASLRGERSQPSEGELDRLLDHVATDRSWEEIFPGVATLRLDTSGSGLSVSLKITKNDGESVALVPEGTPGATLIAVKRVNELSYYSLGLKDLADKIGLTMPRALALVQELDLKSNDKYFREIQIGKAVHKRYSAAALEQIILRLPDLDLVEIWKRRRPTGKSKR